MDYGFAPGGTPFDRAAANYLDWRTESKHLFTLDPTVESFVSELSTSPFVQRPVANLGIGCHGSWTGFLDIRLDSASGKRAHYEDVARVSAAGTIRIPSSVLDPRPSLGGTALNALVRIVGCEVGFAVPYLSKLKEALGGSVVIQATHHDDAVTPVTFNGQQGILRLLLYDFRVYRAAALESKTEVIDAFHDAELKWYDGTNIPRTEWENWYIPNDVTTVGTASSNRWVNFSPAINGVTQQLVRAAKWSHVHEPVGPFVVGPTSPTLLDDPDVRRAKMRNLLSGRAEFQASHPFPLYRARGYASFDAFIDGYDWQSVNDVGTVWQGFRHVYRINRAITVPPSESAAVLYDFVTSNGVGEHLGLPETDPRFFTTV